MSYHLVIKVRELEAEAQKLKQDYADLLRRVEKIEQRPKPGPKPKHAEAH